MRPALAREHLPEPVRLHRHNACHPAKCGLPMLPEQCPQQDERVKLCDCCELCRHQCDRS